MSSTNLISAAFLSGRPRSEDYRYNDRLADYSPEAIRRRHEGDAAFLQRLEAIPTEGFSDQDQLSHDLLIRVLRQRIADFDLKEYEMPINQQAAYIPICRRSSPRRAARTRSKHYEDYISRLHQVPRALSQVTEVLHAGMKDKLIARAISCGKDSGAVSGHHLMPIPSAADQEISSQHFGG